MRPHVSRPHEKRFIWAQLVDQAQLRVFLNLQLARWLKHCRWMASWARGYRYRSPFVLDREYGQQREALQLQMEIDCVSVNNR